MQNPPPGQPATPSSLGGLDPKVAAALSYIWIVGLIFFFMEKENRFIRFHALQSVLFGIANMVLMVVLMILATILTVVFSIGAAAVATAGGSGAGSLIGLLVWLIWLLIWVIGMALFVGLIYAAVKAYQGQMFKLPIIGNFAEKTVNK